MRNNMRQWSNRTILVGTLILSALPLVVVEMFPGGLKFVMAPASYLLFHNIVEFFSVMVSLSMFGIGWYTYDQSKDRHALFLSTAFLAIGLMDFMHTLANAAMPPFVTPNSSNKSTQFWIAVRLFQAIAFLVSAYVYPERAGRWLSKRVLMISALLVPFLVFTGITFFPAYMPATFVPGVGLTPFKRVSEYLIIVLLFAAAVAYWRRMARTGDRLLRYYLAALVICIFSELPFAVYTKVFETYNVLGHIYKVAAFFLIYYGIYKASVKNPYIKLAEVSLSLKRDIAERQLAEQALRKSEEKYRTLLQNIQAAVVVHGSQSEILTCNSSAQKLLGLSEDQMLGKRAADPAWHFFREDGTVMPIEEYPATQVLSARQPLRDFIVGVHRPDRGDVWVLVNADPVFDREGRIAQIIVTFVDVTGRKRTEEALRTTSEVLRERERSLEDLSARLLKAHEEERKRIAGELHDTIGSCLSGIKFKVENVLQQVGKAANVATKSLSAIIPVIQEGIEDCRRMQTDLRPSMLDDLGLLSTLSWFCRRYQTIYTGITVELEHDARRKGHPRFLEDRYLQTDAGRAEQYCQAQPGGSCPFVFGEEGRENRTGSRRQWSGFRSEKSA